jgi:hypothetical protein
MCWRNWFVRKSGFDARDVIWRLVRQTDDPGSGIEWHYTDRKMWVVVDPAAFRGNAAYMLPDCAVQQILVINPRLLDDSWMDSSLGAAWHGFGIYTFKG